MECLNYEGLAYFKGKLDSEISATLIVDSTSGTIASFPDGADGIPIKALTVGIEPVQDLHGQTSPYPAGSTSNKLNLSSCTFTRCSLISIYDGSVKLNIQNGYFAAVGYGGNTIPEELRTRILNGEPITFEANNNNGYSISLVAYGTRSNGGTYQEANGYNNIVTLTPSLFTNVTSIEFRFHRTGQAQTDTTTVVTGLRVSYGETATSFTPYSNICPISGWTGASVTRTGKNLLNCQIEGKTQNGVTSSNNADGTIHFQGTTTGARFYTYLKNNFNLKPGTYRFSKNLSLTSGSISVQLQGFNSANQVISRYTVGNSSTNASVSITEPAAYYNVFIDITGMTTSTAVNLDLEIQLELGSTASAWEQFYGTTIPVSWQSEAGTVYGGMLTVNEDGSADLAANYAKIVFDGVTNKVSVASASYIGANVTRGYKSAFAAGAANPVVAISDCAPYATSAVVSADKQRFNINANSGETNVWLYNSVTGITGSETAAQAATKLNDYLAAHNLTIVYKLAVPVTYHLTGIDQISTLYGINNIWADCGDITYLEYVADTKLYIQKLTQPTEDDMVANNNIASGTYFMVGNNLYLSTTAIARGEAIVPGTNCTATNLAAALNALNS